MSEKIKMRMMINSVLFVVFVLFAGACSKTQDVDVSKTYFSEDDKKIINSKIEKLTNEIKSKNNVDLNLLERANYLSLKQNFQGALLDLNSIESISTNPHALFVRGFVNFELGNDREALSDFTKFLQISQISKDDKRHVLAKKRVDQLESYLHEKETEPEPYWLKIKGTPKCSVYNDNPKPGETVEWSGECKEGKAHGQGVLKWPTYEAYGTMIDGYLEGDAKLQFNNGTIFTGRMKKNAITGSGKWVYSSGLVFNAEYEDTENNYVTKGTYLYPDGRKYEGPFHNNRPGNDGAAFCKDGRRSDFKIVRFDSGERSWNIYINCPNDKI